MSWVFISMEKKLFKNNEEYQPLRDIINNLTDEEIDNYLKLILSKFHITALDLLLEEFSNHLLKENNLPEIDVINFARGILNRQFRYKEFYQKYRQIVLDNHKKYFNRTERGVYLQSDIDRLIKEKKEAKANKVNNRQNKYRKNLKLLSLPKERKKYTRKVPLEVKPTVVKIKLIKAKLIKAKVVKAKEDKPKVIKHPKVKIERIKILKYQPSTPKIKKVKPIKVEKIKKFTPKVRKKKIIAKPVKEVKLTKTIIEHRAKQLVKNQKQLAEIKAEFEYNKANGIKMIISEEDEKYTKYKNQMQELSIINNFNIDDFADSIEDFLKKYIITKYTTLNQFLFEKLCKEYNVRNTIVLYRIFQKRMKLLFDTSDFGKEIAEKVEDNLITYGNFKTLTKRSYYESKESERFEIGKKYYQQVKAEFEKVNGNWII